MKTGHLGSANVSLAQIELYVTHSTDLHALNTCAWKGLEGAMVVELRRQDAYSKSKTFEAALSLNILHLSSGTGLSIAAVWNSHSRR